MKIHTCYLVLAGSILSFWIALGFLFRYVILGAELPILGIGICLLSLSAAALVGLLLPSIRATLRESGNNGLIIGSIFVVVIYTGWATSIFLYPIQK